MRLLFPASVHQNHRSERRDTDQYTAPRVRNRRLAKHAILPLLPPDNLPLHQCSHRMAVSPPVPFFPSLDPPAQILVYKPLTPAPAPALAPSATPSPPASPSPPSSAPPPSPPPSPSQPTRPSPPSPPSPPRTPLPPPSPLPPPHPTHGALTSPPRTPSGPPGSGASPRNSSARGAGNSSSSPGPTASIRSS